MFMAESEVAFQFLGETMNILFSEMLIAYVFAFISQKDVSALLFPWLLEVSSSEQGYC